MMGQLTGQAAVVHSNHLYETGRCWVGPEMVNEGYLLLAWSSQFYWWGCSLLDVGGSSQR